MEEVAVLRGHKDRVWSVVWNGRGEMATTSGDRTAKLWREEGGSWVCFQTLVEHTKTVRQAAWTHDSCTLALSSFDATVSIWKRLADNTFEIVSTLEGHENEVKSVAFDCEDKLLASCSRDKSVWVWVERPEDADYECCSVCPGHSADVKCVSWHPHRPILASCSYDNTVRLWAAEEGDEDSWGCVQELHGHTSTVWQAAWHPDGHLLATCSDDTSVIVWGYQGDRLVKTCTLTGWHPRVVYGVDWSPSGLLATACGDDGIRVFEQGPDRDGGMSFNMVHHQPKAHLADVNAVRWSPDGTLLASCSDDATLKLWRLKEA